MEPAAAATAVARARDDMALELPGPFVSFLRSFDGADLFHEAIVLGGVTAAAFRRLVDMNPRPRLPPLLPTDGAVFAEVVGGDRYAFAAGGRIVRLRGGSDERWAAGADFSRWLDGLIAHERVLYGPDGEFSPDAFDPDGTEVAPLVALRQAERALRACDDSAEWHHERGVALRRLGRLPDAKEAFARAAELDPGNPWPRFDGGRVALDLGPGAAREAGALFEAAACLDRGDAAARLWIWAARAAVLAADPEQLERTRREALACEPALAEQLRRAREAARETGDADEIAEAEALVDALESPPARGRFRLAVIAPGDEAPVPAPALRGAAEAAAARRTPPPVPPRPARATPRRSAAPRAGRKR
ncbi:MAG: tetratricopeptide repeat protein [Verrucomicrobiota bacterium]